MVSYLWVENGSKKKTSKNSGYCLKSRRMCSVCGDTNHNETFE